MVKTKSKAYQKIDNKEPKLCFECCAYLLSYSCQAVFEVLQSQQVLFFTYFKLIFVDSCSDVQTNEISRWLFLVHHDSMPERYLLLHVNRKLGACCYALAQNFLGRGTTRMPDTTSVYVALYLRPGLPTYMHSVYGLSSFFQSTSTLLCE